MAAIYVAGSSNELARASWAMDQVRAAGWDVALDWVAGIAEAGGVANPTDAPRTTRQRWALDALAGVAGASAIWLLAPEAGHARGAFVELGYALAQRRPIVVSGPQRACSIFTALANTEVDTDDQALAVLRGWL